MEKELINKQINLNLSISFRALDYLEADVDIPNATVTNLVRALTNSTMIIQQLADKEDN